MTATLSCMGENVLMKSGRWYGLISGVLCGVFATAAAAEGLLEFRVIVDSGFNCKEHHSISQVECEFQDFLIADRVVLATAKPVFVVPITSIETVELLELRDPYLVLPTSWTAFAEMKASIQAEWFAFLDRYKFHRILVIADGPSEPALEIRLGPVIGGFPIAAFWTRSELAAFAERLSVKYDVPFHWEPFDEEDFRQLQEDIRALDEEVAGRASTIE